MLRNRLVMVLGAGLLSASGAWADGVAYVDCASHPEETQVFAKPRRTPDAVAVIPCGERFTLLLNGFIFSRVQTRDGQVGYVYSSVISMDRSGAAVPPPNATRLSASASAPAVTPKPAEIKPAAPAPVQAPVQQSAGPVAQATPVSAASATAPEAAASSAQTQIAAAASPSREQLEAAAAASLNAAHPEAASGATVQPATTSPAPAAAAQVEAAVPAPNGAAQPEATAASTGGSSPEAAAAQPEATPAEPPAPAAPAIKAEKARQSWERPNAGGRRFLPLFELYGGYAFTRFDSGAGAFTNFNGVLGSFGWNFKPWLQLVADSSYSFVTVSGTKNVLYGNHWGPRVFLRGHGKWSMTPFVEGLVGGTRADTTVSGVGGYKTSENVISYKVGGGLDIKPSRHLEIRVLNVDYYRTSFGTNVHQNNYWASAGIVLRLFGGTE